MKKDLIPWWEQHVAMAKDSPQTYVEVYGANVAGLLWNIGNVLQISLGMAAMSPREIVAGLINISGASMSQFFGHTKWGTPANAAIASIGTFLTHYAGMARGDIGFWMGFMVLMAAKGISMANEPLAERFRNAQNMLLRHTLGQPRRLIGFGAFTLARIPIVISSCLSQDWTMLAFSAFWGPAEIFYGLSKPVAARVVLNTEGMKL